MALRGLLLAAFSVLRLRKEEKRFLRLMPPEMDLGDAAEEPVVDRGGVTTVAFSVPPSDASGTMLSSVPSLSMLMFSVRVGLAVEGVVGLLAGGTGGRFLRDGVATERVSSLPTTALKFRLRKKDGLCVIDEYGVDTCDGEIYKSCSIKASEAVGGMRMAVGTLLREGVLLTEAASPR